MTADQRARRQAGGPPRRAVLAAAGLTAATLPLLSACRGMQVLGSPPPPAADVRALHVAITAEQAMVTRCRAALASLTAGPAASPQAADAVRAVQAEHAAHLAQLRSRLSGPDPSAAPSAAPSASPSPSPSAAPAVTAAAVLTSLEQDEQGASDRLIGQLGGLPPDLAQLFASIAASEAAHVPFLGRARGAS